SVESDALVFAPAPLFDRPFGITECGQGAKFVEVPNEVLPPIANSDDGDARLRPTDSAASHGHLTYPRNSTHLAAARPSPQRVGCESPGAKDLVAWIILAA